MRLAPTLPQLLTRGILVFLDDLVGDPIHHRMLLRAGYAPGTHQCEHHGQYVNTLVHRFLLISIESAWRKASKHPSAPALKSAAMLTESTHEWNQMRRELAHKLHVDASPCSETAPFG